MTAPAVLMMASDVDFCLSFKEFAARRGCEIAIASRPAGALRLFRPGNVKVVIWEVSHDKINSDLEVVLRIRQGDGKVPIILIARSSSEEMAITAVRAGMNDYLRSPCSVDNLWESVTRFLPQRIQLEVHPQRWDATTDPSSKPRMVSESLAMQKINAYLRKVATTESNVLITGETGTGKEMIAHLIHDGSPRRHKPLVCINCAAIPDSLLESELFGYEKGAFTGATALREGKLRIAEGGTLFFDEIGEMSFSAQAKILRAVESREIYRVGGQTSIPLNLRVVAATNRDLQELVGEGKFRADLYYRLKVVSVHLPPLRERREDIPALLTHYLNEYHQAGFKARGFDNEALSALLSYDWPGNVRELKNLIEAVAVNQPTGLVSMNDLPEEFGRWWRETGMLCESERAQVLSALLATNWKRGEAAQKLHWSRMTLYRKMIKYHLDKEDKQQRQQLSSQSTDVTHSR